MRAQVSVPLSYLPSKIIIETILTILDNFILIAKMND